MVFYKLLQPKALALAFWNFVTWANKKIETDAQPVQDLDVHWKSLKKKPSMGTILLLLETWGLIDTIKFLWPLGQVEWSFRKLWLLFQDLLISKYNFVYKRYKIKKFLEPLF